MLRLFLTASGPLLEHEGVFRRVPDADWDVLFNHADLQGLLEDGAAGWAEVEGPADGPVHGAILPPIRSQEVWAAGVTYYRSRVARMEESKDAGGGDFYDRVYEAVRPELFLKATPHRVAGHGAPLRIRSDSKWNVPEPELALAVNNRGEIIGYAVGNDMSSRDIEGENPLYLPQAKVYDGSCGLGPGLTVTREPLSPDTSIDMRVERDGQTVFSGDTTLASLKRRPEELVEFLFRDNSFPAGCYLLTGTGIVPPDSFTLLPGDSISIEIGNVGRLENTVSQGPLSSG